MRERRERMGERGKRENVRERRERMGERERKER